MSVSEKRSVSEERLVSNERSVSNGHHEVPDDDKMGISRSEQLSMRASP